MYHDVQYFFGATSKSVHKSIIGKKLTRSQKTWYIQTTYGRNNSTQLEQKLKDV